MDAWAKGFRRLLDEVYETHTTKRKDYTGDEDPLHNYAMAAQAAGCSTEQAMLGRVQEKVTRVSVLFKSTEPPAVEENVNETLIDIATIALLIVRKRRGTGFYDLPTEAERGELWND